MTLARLLIVSASLIAIAACTSQVKPPPTIKYDQDEITQAVPDPDSARPVEYVPVPEPLPLPGQLKPPVGKSATGVKDKEPPMVQVAAANKKARMEPKTSGYVNAIQVYPFTPGALYRVYAEPDQVSDIGLQPGERLISVSAGDTVRWVVGDTKSGSGETEQVHILVKPIAPDLQTNIVITTDRRAYHLELRSAEHTYMAAVSWSYPYDQLISLQRKNDHQQQVADATVDRGLNIDQLHFRYDISGDNPPWRPVRAFDDGSKVYIQFPRRLDQGEAPPLFVIGPTGDTELVNYRVRGSYYVVDRLFAAAELRLGTDPQQIVRIARTDGIAAK
jgi:type IV secretion system protein VirB9